MRSRYHDAGIGTQGFGEMRNARRWHRAKQADIGAGRDQARFKRRLKHVAGNTGVFSDHDNGVWLVACQNATGSIAQTKHEIGRNNALAHATTNTIGAKIFSRYHSGFRFFGRWTIHHQGQQFGNTIAHFTAINN